MFHGGTLSGCDTQANKHVMVEIVGAGCFRFTEALMQKIPRPVAGGLRN